MTTPTLVLVTIVATLAAAWAVRALWRYMQRVHEAVRHAEGFASYELYRESEYRRLMDKQYALERDMAKLQKEGTR